MIIQRRLDSIFVFLCLSLLSMKQAVAAVTPEDEFSTRIRTSQAIRPIGDQPFGEVVNLYNGSISFRQIDIEQAGVGLPIQLVRTFDPDGEYKKDNRDARAFGDWRLELPSIQTITVPEESFFTGSRCTEFNKAPQVTFSAKNHYNAVTFLPEHWWGGYKLVIPGMGLQDLLKRDSSNGNVPQIADAAGGLKNFSIVTKSNWVVACLPKLSNETSGRGYKDKWGEGFLVLSPEGTKYWMDWLIYREYADIMPAASNPANAKVVRQMAVMLTTRVEDRFGNSLVYHYDDSGNLLDIQSSDGRSLALTYEDWGGWHSSSISQSNYRRITSATLRASDTASRTWTYSYTNSADYDGHLKSVTLPDGSSWSIDFSKFYQSHGSLTYIECDPHLSTGPDVFDVSVRNPSGLIGIFSISAITRGRSYAPYDCRPHFSGVAKNNLMVPNLYSVLSVAAKKISGPGITDQVWKYSYSGPNNSWSKDCDSGCIATVWTDAELPNGSVTRYTFSNRFDYTESQLLQADTYVKNQGSTILHSELYAYSQPKTGPWPSLVGDVLVGNLNSAQIGTLSPVYKKIISQDGINYNYSVIDFDRFARPLTLSRVSPWYSRSDKIVYADNLNNWTLGQIGKKTNTNTGAIESRVDYDTTTAQPIRMYAYEKLQTSLSYNSDGTTATVSDANGGVTRFSGWKRGIPQSIRFSDNSVISVGVNDNGWITSISDPNGYSTTYSYDAMGRVAEIHYPENDSVAWNTARQAFEQINASEYGLEAGHWRQTIATGNARKEIYFDAFWRPIITREYDVGAIAATQRFQRFSYDQDGRQVFASYPGASDNLSIGRWTNYDQLGRPTSVSLDSEQGLLTTLTEYLQGNQTRVTDARGNQTVIGYQVFDQPDYTKPVWIQHPEGAYTDISRDIFGKPVSIRRRDANGTVSVTRSYVYDGYQQLCKTVEPETGATANGYDAAGNLVWSASGLSLPSSTSCDADAAFASGRRVDRSYDVRNRIKALSFPDGNGNQAWSYWPDGAVKQITTLNNGVTTYNSYAYNKRRLLIAESQGQADGETWAIGYAYNADGHLAAHRYPSGQTVDYAPNALGQPTQAGSYATGVSYYPNGAIKQFTYGNGIVHTLTQNARQLPDTSQDAFNGVAFLSDSYKYDVNGNVASISDGATGRGARGNRNMSYDGLDRLVRAESPMFSVATYSYDVLDNLTHVVAPGRDHYYCYDTNWQLTNVKTGGCGGSTVIGMSYDPQGNLSNKNGQAFVFDYGNRLRQATGKETYRYDGNGRRTLALQSAGNIGSLYDQSGALRFQKNQRQSKSTDYILLGGSLVAEADWPLGQTLSVKDYVNWNPVSGATRYVVEESVDGVTWTAVYDGSQGNWTSLARPAGTYSYRVTACTADGNCTAASNVTHDQRPAVDIVPLLYQLLLND